MQQNVYWPVFLLLDMNTWNHAIVCKLFVLDWNTWYHKTVRKERKKKTWDKNVSDKI